MNPPLRATLLIGLPVLLAIGALCIGRYQITPGTALRVLVGTTFGAERTWAPVEETVVMKVRLPRILLALVIGAGLAVAGAAFQGIFGNPLVSPHILGVSAGAGFGAALTILLVRTLEFVPVGALLFGLVAMLLSLAISRLGGRGGLLMLVLAGVITAALFDALIGVLKYVADPNDTLPTITYWLMGSLSAVGMAEVRLGAPLVILGIVVIWLFRWRLNIISLSENEARSLGMNVARTRWILIAASTLITAAAVSVVGIVGWIGLVIPHMARAVVGSDHRKLIPATVSLGACYLLVIDTLGRSLTGNELPLSILTAVIGAPFFALLLMRNRGLWS
ncbi:MAG: iron ABC transporter permease [Trueperaceae bacterium]|nr:iron ABC transporter permease [Trueperaceae bacterium]